MFVRHTILFRELVFLTGAAALLVGCSRHTGEESRGSSPALPVHVQRIETRQRVATEDVVGTVRAKLSAVIEAKVSGRIEEMLAVPGRSVKAGDLLAKLDARELQAQVDRALAIRQQAEGDLTRFTSLLKEKTVTQSEFENVEAKFRVAEANVAETQTLLGYAKVVAPFDGVITRKHADVGDLASPGKPLVAIEDPRVLRLEADVPEALIGKIAVGDKVRVNIPSSNTELDAVASEVSPSADPNSRTFLVKFDLPSSSGVRAGQFGRVAIPVGESTALRAPTSAVIQRGQMEIVFVVSNGRAQLRLVKTGKRIGDEVELVSGVEAGEKVITPVSADLIDNQPVTILP